ncbi:MAG: pectic acid lyase [Planctomycetaceae bacterium]|nr:pectic acid lyase [Planctomycetaceae bacterium]
MLRTVTQSIDSTREFRMKYSTIRISGSLLAAFLLLGSQFAQPASCADTNRHPLQTEVRAAMKRAATWYSTQAATHGGYVYYYSPDVSQRWGEGLATDSQIWVQPPGTPTVGLAYLAAWRATGDNFYLDAATKAAEALAYGQLKSGGWTNRIDFNPRSDGVAAYRNGRGRGKDNSTLDDGISQAALQLLMRADEAHLGRHAQIHEAVEVGLNALLAAQFPNGGFPQVWTGPVGKPPVVQASYAPGDGAGERVKDYCNYCTINDNVTGHVAETLITAMEVYQDDKYRRALLQLGEFLILAQMPEPQPGWSQQYNHSLQPIAARRFEPAAMAGSESVKVIETLLRISRVTGDSHFLKPVPAALTWLERSLLPDGQLARYYELRTNRPLYMQRDGKKYYRTYDDSRLPAHYGWKSTVDLEALKQQYQAALKQTSRSERGTGTAATPASPPGQSDADRSQSDRSTPAAAETAVHRPTAAQVRKLLDSLDGQGRWISRDTGERLVGQPRFRGADSISSAVFSSNLTTLARFVEQAAAP